MHEREDSFESRAGVDRWLREWRARAGLVLVVRVDAVGDSSPGLLLGLVEVAEVENLALGNLAIGAATRFGEAPIGVEFATLGSFVTSKEQAHGRAGYQAGAG